METSAIILSPATGKYARPASGDTPHPTRRALGVRGYLLLAAAVAAISLLVVGNPSSCGNPAAASAVPTNIIRGRVDQCKTLYARVKDFEPQRLAAAVSEACDILEAGRRDAERLDKDLSWSIPVMVKRTTMGQPSDPSVVAEALRRSEEYARDLETAGDALAGGIDSISGAKTLIRRQKGAYQLAFPLKAIFGVARYDEAQAQLSRVQELAFIQEVEQGLAELVRAVSARKERVLVAGDVLRAWEKQDWGRNMTAHEMLKEGMSQLLEGGSAEFEGFMARLCM